MSKSIGGRETLMLEEGDDPWLPAGQILVRVKASGVNFPDTLIIEDRYRFKSKRPFSPEFPALSKRSAAAYPYFRLVIA